MADLSQRGLAKNIGVSPSTIARAEVGDETVSLAVVEAILDAADLRLVVVDRSGEIVQPMRDDAARNHGGNRYPAHLDAQLPGPGADWCPPRDDRRAPRLAFHHRQWRDIRRDRFSLVPRDHSSEVDLRFSRLRGRYRRKPPWLHSPDRPEPELCECGPECELYCMPGCRCQCEPVGVDTMDIQDLYGDSDSE